MYMNETEKLYYIELADGEVFDGTKFVRDLVWCDRSYYTKAKADSLMMDMYRGLPYTLVHMGNEVILCNMDGWCGINYTEQAWYKVDVQLGFAEGYSIRGMGTEETVIQISTNSPQNYYDVHIRGNKITEVYHTFFGERKLSDTLIFNIDNPVGRFFRLTDVKANPYQEMRHRLNC